MPTDPTAATDSPLDPALTVNEIVARYPAAIPVFNRFGLDTCCGGGVTVAEAARRDGISAAVVLDALAQVVQGTTP